MGGWNRATLPLLWRRRRRIKEQWMDWPMRKCLDCLENEEVDLIPGGYLKVIATSPSTTGYLNKYSSTWCCCCRRTIFTSKRESGSIGSAQLIRRNNPFPLMTAIHKNLNDSRVFQRSFNNFGLLNLPLFFLFCACPIYLLNPIHPQHQHFIRGTQPPSLMVAHLIRRCDQVNK